MGEFRGIELNDLVLTGPRLTLRPFEPGDAEDVYRAMRDDPVAHRFLPLPSPYTPEHAQHFVRSLGNEGREAGTGFGSALVETATGRLVGSAALRVPGLIGEVGYAVYPWARGSGFAAEATRVLTSWAFEQGVSRVQLWCALVNLASARTALAAGFSFEGITRGLPVPTIDPGATQHREDHAFFARIPEDDGAPVRPRLPQLPPEGVTDGVLTLRALVPEDVQGFFETEDEVSQQWGFTAEAPSRADMQRKAELAGLDWLVGGQGRVAIIEVATGQFAGTITLRLMGPPNLMLVGYGIHPAFRGRAYTTRALGLLAPWAFSNGIARLELGAKVDNIASQKAARNAGFAAEGVYAARLRNPDGSYSDEARFALLNPSR